AREGATLRLDGGRLPRADLDPRDPPPRDRPGDPRPLPALPGTDPRGLRPLRVPVPRPDERPLGRLLGDRLLLRGRRAPGRRLRDAGAARARSRGRAAAGNAYRLTEAPLAGAACGADYQDVRALPVRPSECDEGGPPRWQAP